MQNLYLETDAGVIDILTTGSGVGDFARLKKTAERLVVDNRECWVMSLEDRIKAKEAMTREKDRLAAMELRAIAAKRRSCP